MKMPELFPGKYLKASDLNGHAVVLEISHVKIEEVGRASDPQTKPVLYFKDRLKGLVLNRTNAEAIASKYGDDTDGWVGQLVELFPTTTQFQGRMVDCIRVRIPVPQADSEADEIPF